MSSETQPFGDHSHATELALRDATIDTLRRRLAEVTEERDLLVSLLNDCVSHSRDDIRLPNGKTVWRPYRDADEWGEEYNRTFPSLLDAIRDAMRKDGE